MLINLVISFDQKAEEIVGKINLGDISEYKFEENDIFLKNARALILQYFFFLKRGHIIKLF